MRSHPLCFRAEDSTPSTTVSYKPVLPDGLRLFSNSLWLTLLSLTWLCSFSSHAAERPNILVIFGDDIGMWNISAYHQGMLGTRTPNIDRIANEGLRFTDYYGEQSCTAGRAAFITGQHPLRTGLLRVGVPGADMGISEKDPTIAELLKPLGYATGQFGKNHLGDRDEFLPTNHGFDEFFGNLYHQNAEEEPETPHYPQDPAFRQKYGPRGVIHSFSDGKIEDTGPLTRRRMETVDDEFLKAALAFIDRSHAADKPFFTWFNSSRMHVWTHLTPEWEGRTGLGVYADGMAEHDHHVGILLDKLEELGIAENTIVVYSTDNGAQTKTFPQGGSTPFRGGKGTTWEGGFRVPALARWPGHFPSGVVINDIFSHQDWLPTLMAAIGEADISDRLRSGYRVGTKHFKVHIDGQNQLPLLLGHGAGARDTFFYFDDVANLNAVRWGEWKAHFATKDDWFYGQRNATTVPRIVNLRIDPFESSPESYLYFRWAIDQLWIMIPFRDVTFEFLSSFREFPPRNLPMRISPERYIEEIIKRAEE